MRRKLTKENGEKVDSGFVWMKTITDAVTIKLEHSSDSGLIDSCQE